MAGHLDPVILVTMVSNRNRGLEALEGRRLLASIAGFWQGFRTEAGLTGEFATVDIKLTLRESGSKSNVGSTGFGSTETNVTGATFTGTEHRGIATDDEYFADLTTGGTLSGNVFTLRDTSITAQDRPKNYTWLLYKATLTLSPDGQTLSGPWRGGNVRGNMTFTRIPLPQISINSATKRDNTSVTVDYTIAQADATQPLRFDIYLSPTRRLGAQSKQIGTQIISPVRRSADLTVGRHRVRLATTTAVRASAAYPYVIILANQDGATFEADGSSNGTWFKLR